MFVIAFMDKGETCDGFPRVFNRKFTTFEEAHNYILGDYAECYKAPFEDGGTETELEWDDDYKATIYIDGNEECVYKICKVD